jgi:hypothetical protein
MMKHGVLRLVFGFGVLTCLSASEAVARCSDGIRLSDSNFPERVLNCILQYDADLELLENKVRIAERKIEVLEGKSVKLSVFYNQGPEKNIYKEIPLVGREDWVDATAGCPRPSVVVGGACGGDPFEVRHPMTSFMNGPNGVEFVCHYYIRRVDDNPTPRKLVATATCAHAE